MRDQALSVVIPVYNSEQTLPELVARLVPVLQKQSVSFEIILVNDGSRDQSWEVISRLMTQWPTVRGFDLSRNYGQHNALLCGIRAARHGVIVTLDDDMQHPPEEIPRLLRKLEEGYDVVYGTARREPNGWWRGLCSRLIKWILARAMGGQASRGVSAFRVFRTSLREAFRDYRSPYVVIDVLLTWGTTRFTSIRVDHSRRLRGVSNYTLRKLVAHAVHLMTGFSTLPLQLASFTGFACTLFGLAVLLWVLGSYLVQGCSQPGFPFLASITAIFAGAQLFALGIVGEYLAGVHFRLMEKPPYVVRATQQGAEIAEHEGGATRLGQSVARWHSRKESDARHV
jgi:glycosyltransferase involved in cell wall biosynthesis